jgi:hypothetical protein
LSEEARDYPFPIGFTTPRTRCRRVTEDEDEVQEEHEDEVEGEHEDEVQGGHELRRFQAHLPRGV